MDDMDGEIELAQHATVRELVARLERERDEARAARDDAWRLLGARIAALSAFVRQARHLDGCAGGTGGGRVVHDANGVPVDYVTWVAECTCGLDALLAPEATPPEAKEQP